MVATIDVPDLPSEDTPSTKVVDPESNAIPAEDKTKLEYESVLRTPGGMSMASSVATITTISTANTPTKPIVEPWWKVLLQVSIPFFLAGIGTIGAGVILGQVQNKNAFKHIPALIILVSPLLGLKGNLDMCLASRLSTLANMGEMDSSMKIKKMIIGNLALVQVQAIVAATCVAIFAVSVSAITSDEAFDFNHAVIMAASGITTATSSCFVLDFVMVAVIVLSHRYKLNPDNLATPLAASIGDVVSISVLYLFSTAFYNLHSQNDSIWVCYLIIGFYLLLLPMWCWVVYHNEYTKTVLTSGWTPVLSALLISGFGGLVMEQVSDRYEHFVVFQPIINGIGGNLVSVQASRISTMLHQTSLPGIIPPYTRLWVWPWTALLRGLPHAQTARVLFLLSIVGQLVFVFAADFIQDPNSTVPYQFVLCYLTASSVQVLLLLYLAHFFVHFMWRLKNDPDNSAIPFLTAIGDLSGSSLLAAAFFFTDNVLNVPYGGEE